MEYLKCDKCGTVYSDEGSIKMAKEGQSKWEELCHKDGVEPRGITPCPNLLCPGEMFLIQEEKNASG